MEDVLSGITVDSKLSLLGTSCKLRPVEMINKPLNQRIEAIPKVQVKK